MIQIISADQTLFFDSWYFFGVNNNSDAFVKINR